jgi:hypothetical protein
MTDPQQRPELDDAPPPLLGSWRNVYGVVLGTLAAVVVLFWALSQAYR